MSQEQPIEVGIGNAEVIKHARMQKRKGAGELPRSDKPHVAIITLKLDIRGYNADATLDPYVLVVADLQKYGISNKAQIIIKGADEAHCVQKVKNLLENLDVKSRQ